MFTGKSIFFQENIWSDAAVMQSDKIFILPELSRTKYRNDNENQQVNPYNFYFQISHVVST